MIREIRVAAWEKWFWRGLTLAIGIAVICNVVQFVKYKDDRHGMGGIALPFPWLGALISIRSVPFLFRHRNSQTGRVTESPWGCFLLLTQTNAVAMSLCLVCSTPGLRLDPKP